MRCRQRDVWQKQIIEREGSSFVSANRLFKKREIEITRETCYKTQFASIKNNLEEECEKSIECRNVEKTSQRKQMKPKRARQCVLEKLNKTQTSKAGAISEAQRALSFKNSKGRPFGLFETSIRCKISKKFEGGSFGDKTNFEKKVAQCGNNSKVLARFLNLTLKM